jgi:hypothetical protein
MVIARAIAAVSRIAARDRFGIDTGGSDADGRNAGTACARHVDGPRSQCADGHRDDHVRPAQYVAPQGDRAAERAHDDQHDLRVDPACAQQQRAPAVEEAGAARDLQAKKRLDLGVDDHDPGCGHEADNRGMRDEIQHRAGPRQIHRQPHGPCEQGDGQRQFDIARAAGLGQRCQRGEQHDRDGVGRAGDQVPGRTEQGCDHSRDHRTMCCAIDEPASDCSEGHALGQDDQCTGQAGMPVGACAVAIDAG